MKKGLNWVHDPVKEVLSQGNNWTCPTLAVCPCLAIFYVCGPLCSSKAPCNPLIICPTYGIGPRP